MLFLLLFFPLIAIVSLIFTMLVPVPYETDSKVLIIIKTVLTYVVIGCVFLIVLFKFIPGKRKSNAFKHLSRLSSRKRPSEKV